MDEVEGDDGEGVEEIERMKKELEGLGVDGENRYMFIEGDEIMENVVVGVVIGVWRVVGGEREEEMDEVGVEEMEVEKEVSR